MTENVNHRAEALRLLAATGQWDSSNPEHMPHVMETLAHAQVHASLAITEGPQVSGENTMYVVVGPDQDEGGKLTLYGVKPTYDRAEAAGERDAINAQWAKHGQPEAWKLYALVEVPR